MKKVLEALLAVLMIFTFTACSSKPEKAVEQFLNDCKKGNLEAFYQGGQEEDEKQYEEFFKTIFSKMTYKIKETKMVNDNQADVTVEITTIDLSDAVFDVMSKYLNWAMNQVLSGSYDEQEMTNKLIELLNTAVENNKDNKKTFTVVAKVTKNSGKWEVNVEDTLVNAITGGFYDSMQNIAGYFN